jgi:hypothetical protein
MRAEEITKVPRRHDADLGLYSCVKLFLVDAEKAMMVGFQACKEGDASAPRPVSSSIPPD